MLLLIIIKWVNLGDSKINGVLFLNYDNARIEYMILNPFFYYLPWILDLTVSNASLSTTPGQG